MFLFLTLYCIFLLSLARLLTHLHHSQLYLLWRKPSPDAISDLNMISIFLSAFSLCWALASFSKNIRTDAIDKLVLTWLGVIFQFLWRLG